MGLGEARILPGRGGPGLSRGQRYAVQGDPHERYLGGAFRKFGVQRRRRSEIGPRTPKILGETGSGQSEDEGPRGDRKFSGSSVGRGSRERGAGGERAGQIRDCSKLDALNDLEAGGRGSRPEEQIFMED